MTTVHERAKRRSNIVQFTESDNETDAHVQVGQQFEISLPENRGSTGYSWLLTSNGEPACAVIDESAASVGGPPGHTAQHVWRFLARQPGRAHISLIYARSWEHADPARTFAIEVQVMP